MYTHARRASEGGEKGERRRRGIRNEMMSSWSRGASKKTRLFVLFRVVLFVSLFSPSSSLSSSSQSTLSAPRQRGGGVVYNQNANPSLQYEPRSGIVTRNQNAFAARPGEGRHRLNPDFSPDGIRTKGVWDATRKRFYAQETLPGPKKFKEEIETLKIEKKPKDVIAHPHVERKFWPKNLVFGRSESGATKPIGRAAPRNAVGEEGEDEEQVRQRRERRQNNRLAGPRDPERADDRAILADHTFYAATNQQSNDRFAKMLIRALNGTKYVKQCQKSEAKKSNIPSAWQLLTTTMSREDAQALLPISPGQLKKSIFGKVTNARGGGSSRLTNRWNGYPKPLDFNRGCAVVGNSGILLKPPGHNKKPLGPFIDAHGFVLRMNIAPTDGEFTKLVGKKTSVRLINHKWAREFDAFVERHSNVLSSDIALQYRSRRDSNDAAYAVRTRDLEMAKKFAKIIGEKRARVFNARFVDISRIALAQIRACKEMRDTGKIKVHETAPAPSAGFAAVMALSKICPRLRLFGFDAKISTKKSAGIDYPYQYFEEFDAQGILNVGSAAHDFDIEAEALRGLERESNTRIQICGIGGNACDELV